MYRNREPAVSRHIKYTLRVRGAPFCNHYSYSFVFVKYKKQGNLGKLAKVGETVGAALRGRPSVRLATTGGHGVPPLQLFQYRRFEVMNQGEEDFDVDGFWD